MKGTEAKAKKIGLTDIPLSSAEEDMLDIRKYAEALRKFVLGCPMPMSIAIQGDWGTGKTSLIRMLERKLKPELEQKQSGIRYVYFNTWQYSQFGMADDLYMSFVHALLKKCAPEAEFGNKLLEKVQKVFAKAIVYEVKKRTAVDITELLTWQKEREESVESMKEAFAELVRELTKGREDGRLIVCIDDLDRLNPEVAVELLEVIKLFMDVEKCVFVLAIDYDVVVSGVRKKYGQDMPEEKCRSFFDKIIQVPFRMPVESYNLKKMIEETVGESVEERDIPPLSRFIGSTLGSNPRAYKRLANSFFLLQGIRGEEQENKQDNVLTFGALCLQMCAVQLYQLLAGAEGTEDFRTLTSSEEWKMLDGREAECAEAFVEFWEQLKKNHSDDSQMESRFFRVLQVASITSVVPGGAQKGGVQMAVDQITVNESTSSVATPTDALVKSYQKLLMEQNGDLAEEYAGKMKNLLTDDESRNDSLFRSKKKLEKSDGTVLYIGVSSGTPVKLEQVRKLCEFLKSKGRNAEVIWEKDGKEVFRA